MCLKVLNHHFFTALAAQLPPEFTTNALDSTQHLQEGIAALEEGDKVLKTRVKTLLAVVVR